MNDLHWKIEAFQQHYGKRMLRIADRLVDSFQQDCDGDELSESGFVVLGIGLMYIEPIAMFLRGEQSDGNSGEFFKFGFREIFSQQEVSDDELKLLWKSSRNGMFHCGMQKQQCHLSREISDAFKSEGNVLIINPAKFIARLTSHLSEYCDRLRDPGNVQLQSNFDCVFSYFSELAESSATTTTETTPEPCASYYRTFFDNGT